MKNVNTFHTFGYPFQPIFNCIQYKAKILNVQTDKL